MKKLYITIVVVILGVSVAFANEVFKRISNASEKVKASTHEMIRVGVDQDKAVDLTALMVQNKFHQKNILKAHGVIIYAQKKKIPVDPIIDKAFEIRPCLSFLICWMLS